jgi:purine-nucleoside phosphorylase
MSLVPECLVAVHGGLRTLAFSVITDRCWPDALEPVDIPQILAVAAQAAPRLDRLVSRVVERLDEAPLSSRT